MKRLACLLFAACFLFSPCSVEAGPLARVRQWNQTRRHVLPLRRVVIVKAPAACAPDACAPATCSRAK
jgi:hypothetical protein